jgi:hypothetical protein
MRVLALVLSVLLLGVSAQGSFAATYTASETTATLEEGDALVAVCETKLKELDQGYYFNEWAPAHVGTNKWEKEAPSWLRRMVAQGGNRALIGLCAVHAFYEGYTLVQDGEEISSYNLDLAPSAVKEGDVIFLVTNTSFVDAAAEYARGESTGLALRANQIAAYESEIALLRAKLDQSRAAYANAQDDLALQERELTALNTAVHNLTTAARVVEAETASLYAGGPMVRDPSLALIENPVGKQIAVWLAVFVAIALVWATTALLGYVRHRRSHRIAAAQATLATRLHYEGDPSADAESPARLGIIGQLQTGHTNETNELYKLVEQLRAQVEQLELEIKVEKSLASRLHAEATAAKRRLAEAIAAEPSVAQVGDPIAIIPPRGTRLRLIPGSGPVIARVVGVDTHHDHRDRARGKMVPVVRIPGAVHDHLLSRLWAALRTSAELRSLTGIETYIEEVVAPDAA